MRKMYYYPDDLSREEREVLISKTSYYMNDRELPEWVIKPGQFLYDDGCCIGYDYDMPDELYITLHELFQEENLMKYQIDDRILCKLAEQILNLLKVFAQNKIYTGFLELTSVLVNPSDILNRILISHPEKFQAENMGPSCSWYPSDALLFDEEFELFDSKKQKKADAKLIYRILTAFHKGNAKIPPSQKKQEISWKFWNCLTKELKDFFINLSEMDVDYDTLLDMLSRMMHYTRLTTIPVEPMTKEESSRIETRKKAYALFVILRQADKSSRDISRELYLLQERLDMDPVFHYEQGFVLGDKHVYQIPFHLYSDEYKCQLKPVVKEYSFAETLCIASDMMEAAVQKEYKPSFLFLLLDGEIKNDKLFNFTLKRLEKLQESCYTKLILVPACRLAGEGYQKLEMLCKKGY